MVSDAVMNPIFTITKLEGSLQHIDNLKLEQEILNNQTRLSEVPHETTFEDMYLLTEEGSEGKKLIDAMREVGESLGCCLSGYWQHTHRYLESSELHFHSCLDKDLTLSWVYYVKAPENSGNLVFVLDTKDLRTPISVHAPSTGKFVVFPSFLLHKVTKNMSNDLRISVAGDFIPFGGRGAYK